MAKSLVPDLLALRETAQTGSAPVITAWTRLSLGAHLAGTEFPDEEDVVTALTQDFRADALNRLFSLFGQPKPIGALRERHARVMRAPQDHVLEVSRVQYAELLKLVASESELDKRRRTLDRAQERRRTRVDEITREMDRLDDELGLLLLQPFLEPDLRRLLPTQRFKNLADWKKVSARNVEQFRQIFTEIGPILMELQQLEGKLAVISRCKSKLARLKARMDAAGPQSASGTLPTMNPIQAPLEVRPEVQYRPSVPGPRRPVAPKDTPVVLPVPEVATVEQLSLDRVREAVALGNQEGALRLMLPEEGEVRRRHERGWTTLLNELGFTGELIVAPSYESLTRGSAPILMPIKMHTHTGRWKTGVTAPLFVIDFAFPNFLLRLHQTGKL